MLSERLHFIRQHPYELNDAYIGMLVYNTNVNVKQYQGFKLVTENRKYGNAEIPASSC